MWLSVNPDRVFDRGQKNEAIPTSVVANPVLEMNTSLPWKPGDDIVLRREKTGLKDSAGGDIMRVATNVAWSCFGGSQGFEWGFTGSGPRELAFNILNQFVPPGTDGFRPQDRSPPHWAQEVSNRISKTAASLAYEFERDFLTDLPQQGGLIKSQDIRDWIVARAEKVRSQDFAGIQ